MIHRIQFIEDTHATAPQEISVYVHCGKCLAEWKAGKAPGQSPRDYARLSIGWTQKGFQVWCTRHECNVVLADVRCAAAEDGEAPQP